jgi:peptide/nickel transport system substrate-binding protein
MVLTLLLASCGEEKEEPAVSPDIQDKPSTEQETVETEEEYADPLEPKYGGTFTRIRLNDIKAWDYAASSEMFTVSLTGEELLMGDWTRGPAGTNENDWTGGFGGFVGMLTGKLAESWSMPDNETFIYNIRPGVHYWDKAPANGRELTAEDVACNTATTDVAWNIERHFSSPLSYLYNSYTPVGKAPLSATAIDTYTVEVKVKPEWQGLMVDVLGDNLWLICPDVVEANGGEPLDVTQWAQFIGTGCYMIEDYVQSSYLEYVRNPDYWQFDPLHPENRLPYPDGMKELIIADASTQLAGFRTGQIDTMAVTSWEDVEQLRSKNPDLMVKSTPASSINLLWPRLDNENLPFNDIRVRYAMNLAVNQQEILEDYYGGNADILGWPYPNLPVFSTIYTPLEEQSEIVQDLFGYDVERAKELLTEAGYPDGFKFRVDCASTHSDYLSIIKEYLAAIDIEMELANLEWSVYLSVWTGGTYTDMVYANDYCGKPYRMMCMTEASIWNYSRFKHDKTETAVKEIAAALGRDDSRVAEVLKEIGPWELEQAVPIYLPSPHAYTMWWPWLQNFYGATGGGGNANLDEYLMYLWLDTDMKTKMGH